MKKIYMILAAITLLLMSLNAQVMTTKQVVNHQATPTAKVNTPPDLSINKASKPAGKFVPKRVADRATETANLNVFIDTTTYVAEVLPIYGYWHDASQHNQMIYPASLLTDMVGKKITSMTFFPASYDSNSGINFRNGTVTFKLMEVNNSSGFASSNPSYITGTMTTVKTVSMPSSANTSATTWLIEFDNDYEYNGGDLVIDVTNTTGNYGHTYFYIGTTTSLGVARPGLLQYSSNSAQSIGYVPAVIFTYEYDAQPQHDLGITLSAPESVGAGNSATVSATVTNNGDFDETGYTVTFYADGTAFSTQTGTSLAIGDNQTFEASYTTTDSQSGSTVNLTAVVSCTGDANATNDEATAVISVITLPPPENVAATSSNQSGTMTWDAPSNLPTVAESVTESFENGLNGWTAIDADGDGYNWTWSDNNSSSSNMITNTGTCIVYSESYHNNESGSGGTILYPDNWLISPEVILNGTLSLYACGQDGNGYHNEVFGVYVCVGDNNGISGFNQVGADVTTTHSMTQYTYDLSQYQGQVGHIAIVHHNVQDQFILNIDDVTYLASVPIEPVSYNIYLDGQLVDNVNSDVFTYTFNNVSDGEHQCAVSAVYPGGIESAAVPTTFTIVPKTPTPVITYNETATEMVVTATGQGTVILVVNGQTYTGEGTVSATIPRGTNDQTYTATATAQLPNYQVSDEASATFVVHEAGRSPMPSITMTDNGDGTYTITVTGTGEVAMYINDAEHGGTSGDPVATGQGSVSITVEQHSQAMTLPIQATNQEPNLAVSHTAEETYTIPAMTIDNSFQQLDPQPTNATTPINMSKLMFVDRFSVVIPYENDHPRLYDYYLQETQVRQRTSNSVEVPVKHTGSDGLGFYSLNQIDNDLERELVMDVRNAAMDLPLEADPGIFFYTAERSTAAYPDEADRKWLGVLQRTSDGNYAETLNPSYDYEEVYPGGQHHIHLDVDTILGQYNQYLTYVPVVWTMGFDRVLYPTDHTHNSYGAPKWKTGVADVYVNAVDAERQINSASTTWNDNGQTSMYMLTVNATGVMPTVNTMPYEPYMFRVFVESANGKLRGWKYVEADSATHTGSHYAADEGSVTGPICVWSEYVKNSPYITINGNEVYFVKNKVEERDSLGNWVVPRDMNIMFAALDNLDTEGEGDNEHIIEGDLKIYVRFYYIVEGSAEGHTPHPGVTMRDGDAPAGYGSESPGTPPSPSTGVKEVNYYGDVVSTTYYNVQGMSSSTPFNGINIVVTRYSNGTTRTTKVVR